MKHSKKAHRRTAAWAAVLVAGTTAFAQPNGLYEETKATVEQWAEAESLISSESNQWIRDKAVLEELAAMLEAEEAALQERIEATRASATESDKKRDEIVGRKESLEAAGAVVRASLEELEEGARGLVPYLPENYVKSIQSLLRQLPKKGQPTQLSASIRLRNVIGILSQANKFDGSIALETETRSFAGSETKQVNTLYLGFAIAYYSDAAGENAGYGYPTAEGWKWTPAPESAPAILEAISMYQKGKQARFVTLPVVVN